IGVVGKYALDMKPELKSIVQDVVDGAMGALDAFHDASGAFDEGATALGDPDATLSQAADSAKGSGGAQGAAGSQKSGGRPKTRSAQAAGMATRLSHPAARREHVSSRVLAAVVGRSPAAR